MITCPKVEQPLPRRGCLFLSWAFGLSDFFIIYHISRPTVKCIFFFHMTSKIKPSRRNLNHRVVAFRTQSSNRSALFFLYLPITDAYRCARIGTLLLNFRYWEESFHLFLSWKAVIYFFPPFLWLFFPLTVFLGSNSRKDFLLLFESY